MESAINIMITISRSSILRALTIFRAVLMRSPQGEEDLGAT